MPGAVQQRTVHGEPSAQLQQKQLQTTAPNPVNTALPERKPDENPRRPNPRQHRRHFTVNSQAPDVVLVCRVPLHQYSEEIDARILYRSRSGTSRTPDVSASPDKKPFPLR